MGTADPLAYERLAIADRALGREREAEAAARTAAELAGKL